MSDKFPGARALLRRRRPAPGGPPPRPGALAPLILSFLLLLFAAALALTREGGEGSQAGIAAGEAPPGGDAGEAAGYWDWGGAGDFEDGEAPAWIPPSPPRWFRSNAGGMALEEIPSRLAALRSRHALVIDFISPDELEPFLKPFFREGFGIEIRVLFERGEESRRQWLFVDGDGVTRLNASFRRPAGAADFGGLEFLDSGFLGEGAPPREEAPPEDGALAGAASGYGDFAGYYPEGLAGAFGLPGGDARAAQPPPPGGEATGAAPVGFVEVFGEQGRIAREYLFSEDGAETLTSFFYGGGLLVRAETKRREPGGGEFAAVHTDHFRYNRSLSLRYVRRVFYGQEGAQPQRVAFPARLLDAALAEDFIRRVTPGTDFMETFFDAGDGYNVRYETDPAGRVLSQALLGEGGEPVWEIRNTWEGDRIVAISRIEGGEERVTEFEFDGSGSRVVQREMRNGVVERVVRTDGDTETEDLYMDGALVMRALWEGGRRISEERVRR